MSSGVRHAATEPQAHVTESRVRTYRAAVVREFGSPLTVGRMPAAELTPGQVRVKVEASGLCHTDIHAAHGDWPVKPSPPFVPGHEGVGIVVELGPGVTEVALGDRVAMVAAVDLIDEKLKLARELGAEFTINAAEEDPMEAIQRLGGADQAIALAVSPRAFEQAYGSLRRGGTLVFVALPADNEVKLPIFETVLNGITIVGSIVGTRAELREVFELHAAGRTHVIRETRSLDDVNEAIADVEAGRVAARIVFEP